MGVEKINTIYLNWRTYVRTYKYSHLMSFLHEIFVFLNLFELVLLNLIKDILNYIFDVSVIMGDILIPYKNNSWIVFSNI